MLSEIAYAKVGAHSGTERGQSDWRGGRHSEDVGNGVRVNRKQSVPKQSHEVVFKQRRDLWLLVLERVLLSSCSGKIKAERGKGRNRKINW